jgi:hypothetical protein
VARGEALASVTAANAHRESGTAQACPDFRWRVQALVMDLTPAPPAAAGAAECRHAPGEDVSAVKPPA